MYIYSSTSQTVIFTCNTLACHECIGFNNWLYHNVCGKAFFQMMAIDSLYYIYNIYYLMAINLIKALCML